MSWLLSARCVELVRRSPLVAYVELDLPQTTLGVQVREELLWVFTRILEYSIPWYIINPVAINPWL